jgi:UDP-N-acetylmuramoylalanine--D-glutamate ligase
MELAGRRVAVVGLGRSGLAAAAWARGAGAQVSGFDEGAAARPAALAPGVACALGPLTGEQLAGFDVVVVSPGVAASHPAVQAARDAGAVVVGEAGLAAAALPVPWVGITGTNGKSTVTHFTGMLLRADRAGVFVGGNLGLPLCTAALGPAPVAVVAELSSYQLELPGPLAPAVGVLLNLTPDHLARHGDMDGYARAKCRLFAGMGPDDLAVIPADDARVRRWADEAGRGRRAWLGALPGVVREGLTARVVLPARGRWPAVDARLDLSAVPVLGAHNLDHAATAAMLALAVGACPGRVEAALATLSALPHRMEVVHERDGVVFVNDSKATNVASTVVALEGLDRPAVVLLGGAGKGESLAPLVAGLRRHRAVLTFGASGPAFAEALGALGVDASFVGSLREAVEVASATAIAGDAVLLSPAAASFDAFGNFEERGRAFAAWAREVRP